MQVTDTSSMRAFDPARVGALECMAWTAYYRREWWRFLYAILAVTQHAFGLTWPQALRAAWWVLRANQVWAPYPHNDPDAARRFMTKFYDLVGRSNDEPIDAVTAARLEVRWWQVHRTLQRECPGHDDGPLVDAIVDLYRYTYRVDGAAVRIAAAERVAAMRLSDRWVDLHCDPTSPLVTLERAALVRAYAALLAAVHGPWE